MKREIKFRAMAVSSGEWVYGNFIHSKRFAGCGNEYRIHNPDTGLESDIDIETIGQFTGLRDRGGVEIYEGDIIDFDRKEWGGDDNIHTVEWDEHNAEWSWGGGCTGDMDWRTVIGNIHEQKERK